MINVDSNSADALNNMTDEELKELFESLEDDYWIDEYKNIF